MMNSASHGSRLAGRTENHDNDGGDAVEMPAQEISPEDEGSAQQSREDPTATTYTQTFSIETIQPMNRIQVVTTTRPEGEEIDIESLAADGPDFPGSEGETRKGEGSRGTPSLTPSDSGKGGLTPEISIGQRPIGYPSVAAFASDDIDGRIYRRFSYLRNRLLLIKQDQIMALEEELFKVDMDDLRLAEGGDQRALFRLTSRRYDEFQQYDATRQLKIAELDTALEQYDAMLLREHEICSINQAAGRQRKALLDFVKHGKECGDRRYKHFPRSEMQYLSYDDDLVILGTQEDAWLGTFVQSLDSLIPRFLRNYILAGRKDRAKGKSSVIKYYSNARMNAFVKALVCAASTVLLVVPIIILYLLSVQGASGWLKIGIMLVFVVVFSAALSVLTNTTRSEMFGAAAGYTAVLIVFLTFTG